MKLRSDNIAQFFVTERDAMTFPILSVASRPHIRAQLRYRRTVYTPEVAAAVDVLRQLGTIKDALSLQ